MSKQITCPDCLARDCDQHKEPRPTEGKPVTAIESVICILRETGMQDFYLKEIEKRHTLFPKLLAALEEEHNGKISEQYGEKSFKHFEKPCDVCALLQEARQEKLK